MGKYKTENHFDFLNALKKIVSRKKITAAMAKITAIVKIMRKISNPIPESGNSESENNPKPNRLNKKEATSTTEIKEKTKRYV